MYEEQPDLVQWLRDRGMLFYENPNPSHVLLIMTVTSITLASGVFDRMQYRPLLQISGQCQDQDQI